MGGVGLHLNYFKLFLGASLIRDGLNDNSSIYGNAAVFVGP